MKRLELLYRYITKHWNALLAGVSILGIAIGALIPAASGSRDYFIFLGLNAVVWTLVEVRSLLRRLDRSDPDRGRGPFVTMREARPLILQNLLEQLQKPGERVVTIIGGRLRSIVEVMREFDDLLLDMPTSVGLLRIRILSVDPGFWRTAPVAGSLSEDQRIARLADQASQVEAAHRELQRMAKANTFASRSISIELSTYADVPFIYCYLFGDDALIWGGYRWDEERSDIRGPSSPCELVRSGSPRYQFLRNWLGSRANMYDSIPP